MARGASIGQVTSSVDCHDEWFAPHFMFTWPHPCRRIWPLLPPPPTAQQGLNEWYTGIPAPTVIGEVFMQGAAELRLAPVYQERIGMLAEMVEGAFVGGRWALTPKGWSPTPAELVLGQAPLSVVTAFRVEGGLRTHVIIGERGQVLILKDSLKSEERLFINFGSRARAESFFARRMRQGECPTLKAFDVREAFVEELRQSAVPERFANIFPDQPIMVDITKAPDQFGLSQGLSVRALVDGNSVTVIEG